MNKTINVLRKQWNYTKNIPRCQTCVHFDPSRNVLINSLPRRTTPWCRLGDFGTAPFSICDMWKRKDQLP